MLDMNQHIDLQKVLKASSSEKTGELKCSVLLPYKYRNNGDEQTWCKDGSVR
jgi:hypothetical protein